MLHKRDRRKEKGAALFLSLFALMLLTALAAGMMFMSSTETSINSNFKGEEAAYFAARAGVEEVRDRMLSSNSNTIATLLPTALPGAGTGALYVLQNGVTASDFTTLSSSNAMADTELCHDFSFGGMTSVPANVPCSTLPSGSSWYTTTASVAPYSLDYKWVRVTLKENGSSSYMVDSTQAATRQVCWNGASEVVLPSGVASCAAMAPSALPVYMITALAVTNTGARRMVQQEIALTPNANLPGGLFATSTGCSALNIAGGAATYSYNSATQGSPTNPPSNAVPSGGNVGANGSIALGGSSTDVNGSVNTNLPATVGSCPASGVSVSGNPGYSSIVNFATPYVPPAPAVPNPLPPTTNKTYRNTTLSPGSYGNITFQGSNNALVGGTTAAPAVFTFNSISFNGNANLNITGPVVINLAGVGVHTVLDMTGGSFSNTTYVASDFVINYAGTDSMVVSGGTAAYAVINAPNAPLSFHGGSKFYGQAVASTIDDQGGTTFYWDTSLTTPTPTNPYFNEISLREVSY